MAVLATLLRATVVSGQTPPGTPEPPQDLTPTTPSEEPAATEPRDTGSEPQSTDGISLTTAPPPRWDYGLSVGSGYDSNIGYRTANGPSSMALTSYGTLGRTFTGRQTELRLGGTGSWQGYREQELLNRYNFGFGADAHHRASRHTSWEANAYYWVGYSDQSVILAEQGVALPLVRTSSASARLGMARTLGERTSFRLSGYYTSVQFDQQDALGRDFSNGQSVRGTAGLSRKLGRRDSATLQYSLSSTLSRQEPVLPAGGGHSYYLTHYASLRLHHYLSHHSAVLLEGGASYTPEAQTAGLPRRASFYGGLGYSVRIRRSDLHLFARRSVTPAFGLGVSRVQTTLGLKASIAMGRSWAFRIMGRHSIPETPEGFTAQYSTSDDVFGELAKGLGRHFAISAVGRYRRRGARGDFPEIDSYQVGIFVSFAGPSRPGSGRIRRF